MAIAQFIHDGGTIDYIPPANVTACDVVVQGELVGVAKLDIKAGKLGALAVVGVFDFPAEDPGSWGIGQLAYWHAGDQWIVSDSGGGANKLIGKVVAGPGNPSAPGVPNKVRVRMSQ